LIDSKNGQSEAYLPPARLPSLAGISSAWREQDADAPRPRPFGEESPCNSHTKRQHDRGQVVEAAILPDGCLQHPEQVQEARAWLVRVLARRGVKILRAKQGEQK